MSNSNTEDENQDKKDSDTIKQAAADVAIYIHSVEDEEKDVRRTVLREEKINTRGENEPVLDRRGVCVSEDAGNVIFNVQVVAQQAQGGIWPGQGQPQQGQGQPAPASGQPANDGYGWSSMASGVPMEKEDRGPFIQKVLFVLFLCLSATFIFAVLTFAVDGVRTLFSTLIGMFLGILGMILVIAMTYTMMCSECGRKAPCNYICLGLTVVGECLFFAFITARYSLKIVVLGLFVTCLIVLVCFCLAFTPLDFTKCYMYLFVICIVLMVFAVTFYTVQLVFKETFPKIHLILALALTLFQAVVFIMEVQMILGGKTIELGLDDWAVGVFMLYTSIMTILFDVMRVINILEYI